MPLVLVTVKEDNRNRPGWGRFVKPILRDILPKIIAEALSVPSVEQARLTPDEIEVKILEPGEFDVNTKNLEIVIFANYFPERQAILKQAVDCIISDLLRELDIILMQRPSGFVWIRLAPAEFKEF